MSPHCHGPYGGRLGVFESASRHAPLNMQCSMRSTCGWLDFLLHVSMWFASACMHVHMHVHVCTVLVVHARTCIVLSEVIGLAKLAVIEYGSREKFKWMTNRCWGQHFRRPWWAKWLGRWQWWRWYWRCCRLFQCGQSFWGGRFKNEPERKSSLWVQPEQWCNKWQSVPAT